MLLAAILLAYALAYLARSRTLVRRGRPVPAWRAACFFAGLAVLGVTIAGWYPRHYQKVKRPGH